MQPAITAIGTAVPQYKQHQAKAAEMIASVLALQPAQKRILKSVYNSTQIEYRHSVIADFCKTLGNYDFFPNDVNSPFPSTAARMRIYKDNALNLALSAIFKLDTDLQAITHLITVSCTGMYAPGLDIELVRDLKLNPAVKRTSVNFMGCYGAFNGIKLADAICRADRAAKVLVVSVELCTLHFQKNASLDSLFSNAIFADGAAAVLIEAVGDSKKKFSLESFYCDLLPQYDQDMTWHIGDNGFDMVLSSYIPKAIQSGIAAFTQRLLKQSDCLLDDIAFYAIHPGGAKVLKACEQALHIEPEQNQYSYDVLRQYGNMSSATVLFVLKQIWDDIGPSDNAKKIFSCAFGPGLTLEGMVLKCFLPAENQYQC